MSTFRIKAGDTGRPYKAQLLDGNLQPIDLTNKTVNFVMKDRWDVIVVNAGAVVLTPPDQGGVQYNWQATDVARVGRYTAWWVVDPIGQRAHAPSAGNDAIIIESGELD